MLCEQKQSLKFKLENSTKSLYLMIEKGKVARPVQISNYVNLITKERFEKMFEIEHEANYKLKKSNLLEIKHRASLVLKNKD